LKGFSNTTKKDIPERKTPFFFILKSLSNKQHLFFHPMQFDIMGEKTITIVGF